MEPLPYIEIALRIAAALGLGAVVGVEREWGRHPAGLRTMMLVSVGSAGFMLLSMATFAGGSSGTTGEAEISRVHPLSMVAYDSQGKASKALAINEVSLFRETFQAAKLRISIDGKVRMEELICDGVLVATPAGSTAYNLSAHGPILPINAPLLTLTPISPFRPRRWRGALLPDRAAVTVEVLDNGKRPVAAVADHAEVRDVSRVDIRMDHGISMHMLFDPGHSLDERILREQFGY